jgi:hypothetical protein
MPIDVLPRLYGSIFTTSAVVEELRLPHFPATVQQWAQGPPSWLMIEQPQRVDFLDQLDAGEASAISLAVERHADAVLIDERNGTMVARSNGLSTIGTLPHFLDPTATEDFICQLYEFTREQVASARAYVLNNPDTVMAQHLEIEARMAEGNGPEVIAQAERTHAAFLDFKRWLPDRDHAEGNGGPAKPRQDLGVGPEGSVTFREWFNKRNPRLVGGT